MNNLMRDLALQAIALYQRYLSPYKGYRCAYAFHTGCASCSRLGFRAIRWRGVLDGLALLARRLARCCDIFEHRRRPSVSKAAPQAPVIARDQRGFCDALACIPCDAGCALSCDAAPLDAALDCINVGACPSPCDCCNLVDLRSGARRREDQAMLASRDAERRKFRGERWPS